MNPTNAWWSWSMQIYSKLHTGKRHHSNLLQCFYDPLKFIRVVLGNTVKSTRKVRWHSRSIGAHLQCKHSLDEGHLVLSILYVVAKLDVRWPMQTNFFGSGLHFDIGGKFIKWSAFQTTFALLVRPPAASKKPELFPRPSRVSITDFNIICGTISHKKLCGSFGGYGRPRQKARLFVTEGISAKKAQIQ